MRKKPEHLTPEDVRLLTHEQVAELLAIESHTLYQWRHQGKGPAYLKMGREVRYRLRDIIDWQKRKSRRASAFQAALANRRKKESTAISLLHAAIRRGKITRGDTCEICGSKERIEAHHQNYDLPFSVNWLCDPCHHRIHSAVNTLKRIVKINRSSLPMGQTSS